MHLIVDISDHRSRLCVTSVKRTSFDFVVMRVLQTCIIQIC